ncbi:MAG: arylsulfatase B [Parvibaculales bacterium]
MKRQHAYFVAAAVVVLVVGAMFHFRAAPSSTYEFSDQQTENLSALIKDRPADAPPPNVIILLADDLGWADVGYRGSDIRTPNIDRLAKEGMRLERFYATPFCSPTRAALMTGRDPIKLGVAHSVLMAWDNGGVAPEEHFMPESFKAAGYQTAMIGKWHLGHTLEQHTPNARGFDHFYGHFNTDVNYYTHSFAQGYDFQENGETVDHSGEYATDVHGDQTVRYLRDLRDPDKPFFLYVPFLAPHSPMQAKEEDIAKYPHRLDLPMGQKKTYAAMVDSLDQAIGQILDELDAQGLTENTIILFFTDNGGFGGFGGDNTPLRGEKLTPFEGGVRVNALLRWPDVIPADTVNENVISVLDMLPTLTHAAGIQSLHEKEIDGIDRWDAVLGKGEKDRGDPLYFTSNLSTYNYFQYGVLDGPWKLYQKVDHQRRTTEVETMLFNVWEDPNESKDLSEELPEQVERLQDLLDERLALHPVGGTYVKISPHPGWRAPKDYAKTVLPADSVIAEKHPGFGPLKSKVLQQNYGERGRILYD